MNVLARNGQIFGDAPSISEKLMDIAITITSSMWVSDSGSYKCEIAISGMPNSITPIVEIQPVGDDYTDAEYNAMLMLDDVDVDNGKLIFHATEKPSCTLLFVCKGMISSKSQIDVPTISNMQSDIDGLSDLIADGKFLNFGTTSNTIKTITTESNTCAILVLSNANANRSYVGLINSTSSTVSCHDIFKSSASTVSITTDSTNKKVSFEVGGSSFINVIVLRGNVTLD